MRVSVGVLEVGDGQQLVRVTLELTLQNQPTVPLQNNLSMIVNF